MNHHRNEAENWPPKDDLIISPSEIVFTKPMKSRVAAVIASTKLKNKVTADQR